MLIKGETESGSIRETFVLKVIIKEGRGGGKKGGKKGGRKANKPASQPARSERVLIVSMPGNKTEFGQFKWGNWSSLMKFTLNNQ